MHTERPEHVERVSCSGNLVRIGHPDHLCSRAGNLKMVPVGRVGFPSS